MNPDTCTLLEFLVDVRANLGRATGGSPERVYFCLRDLCRNIDRRVQREKNISEERARQPKESVTA